MNGFDTKLDELLDRLRSGDAVPEEVAEMERLLAADPELRKHYRARMRMESQLSDTFQEHPPMILPFDPPAAPNPRSRWQLAAAGVVGIAASIVGALLIGGYLSRSKSPESVAVLESASNAAWESPLARNTGSDLPPGVLRLKTGIASVRFHSGALVNLEAPAIFEIETAMRGRLISGRALIEAPESAHGFIVDTPYGHVTDHGTRFSISVDRNEAEASCEILEGEISLHHDGTGKVRHMRGQEASVLDDAGIRVLKHLPSRTFQQPIARSIRLGTDGRETSVIRNNLRDENLHPSLLMVKRTVPMKAGKFDRRALFTIGLGKVDASEIKRANLRLNLVPSGLGFAAYLPEVIRFGVYGIVDEGRENWTDDNLQWKDAPGYLETTDGSRAGLNSDEVKLLGTFDVQRGHQSGSILIETDALTDFIRTDTTGRVSFLVVGETDVEKESSGGGVNHFPLVHAFASTQHPEASGPTLEIFPGE